MKGLLFTILILGPMILLSQNNDIPIIRDSRVINPVPPTPEMASLGKYGDISFEKSKGTASMSIPIHTINYDGVIIPLQLQYSSSGFQPTNVGSYLGLHWSLTGAGGISRSIKGLPDEDGYLLNNVTEAWVDSVHALHGTLAGQGLIDDLNQGTDISQDAYTLSANDLNGQFFIDANKNYKFSVKNDLKLFHHVSYSGGVTTLKFWVIDAKGNMYEFDATEKTYVTSTNGYSRTAVTQDGVTAWKLTRIITASGKQIVFNYSSTNYVYNYSTASQDVFTSKSDPPQPPDETVQCGCSENDDWKYGTNQYYHHSKLLTSIVTDNETVEFTYEDDNAAANYQKKLTTIVVKNKLGAAIKKFQFSFGYYSGNNRLKLTNFKVIDPLGSINSTQIHSFTYYEEYNIPATNTRALDGFKYYNGANTNTHLIYSTQPALTYHADRIVRPEYQRQTLLKEIIYPTGGITDFIYECNGNLDSNNIGPGLRVKRLINKNQNGDTASIKDFKYRYFKGLPLMINNIPHETFVEYTIVGVQCQRMVLTSDNQFSSIGNTIPLSEDFYYEEVDMLEKVGSADIKSTFKFTDRYSMDGDLQVRPREELSYQSAAGSYSLVKKIEYNYEGPTDLTEVGSFVKQFAVLPTQLYGSYAWPDGDDVNFEWCVSIFMGIAKSLPRFQTYIRIKEKIITDYTSAGNLTSFSKYTYGPSHEMPLQIKTTDSKGDTLERKVFYPSEAGAIAGPALTSSQLVIFDSMVSRNMIQYIIAQEFKRDGVLKDATRTTYEKFNNRYYLPKEEFDRKPDGSYEKKINFLDYDTSGNILRFKKENDIENVFIWDYNNTYPVAQIVNSSLSNTAYTSFETDGKGGWSFNGLPISSIKAVTGKKSYSLVSGSITKTGLQTGVIYLVSYWRKDGSGTSAVNSVNGTVVITKSGWTLYKHEITGVSSITVAGTGTIDELRLHPSDATMSTNTFQPLIGIISRSDANNNIVYYEYDGLGRLIVIKDHDGNILKRICYNYAGQAEECNVFYNVEKYGNYTKNNCAGGSGSTVTYTVPANVYSASSQLAADAIAQNDVNANGQAYANQYGTCLYSSANYSGTYYSSVCDIGEIPEPVYVSVPANMFTSSISQADANNQALAYAQNYADTYGVCSSNVPIYGQNDIGDNVYIILTNTSTYQQYYLYMSYFAWNSQIGSVPPGNYNVEMGTSSGWTYASFSAGCSNFSWGYTAYFYNINIDAFCNSFSFY